MRDFGHTDCGIYLRVTAAGALAVGDRLGLRQPGLDLTGAG